MLLQWILPFEGQCPYCTWNESLPFMLYKNNINIHEHFSFNHVMSSVNKIPTPYLLWVTSFTKQIVLFLHEVGPPALQWVSLTMVSRGRGSPLQWKPFAVQYLINLMLRTAAKMGELLPRGLLMLLKLVQHRTGAVFRALQCTRLKGQTESAALQV